MPNIIPRLAARQIGCVPVPAPAIPILETLPKQEAQRVARLLSYLGALTSQTFETRSGLRHWINVHHLRMRSLFGNAYRRDTIEVAKQLRLIEVNERFSRGDGNAKPHTKSYRLAKAVHTSAVAPFPAKPVKRLTADIGNLKPVGAWIVGNMSKLTIPDEVLERAEGWSQIALANVAAGESYARRCDFGRMHFSWTAVGSQQRAAAILAGEPIAEIDLRNAQPLMLGIAAHLFNNQHPDTNKTYGQEGGQGLRPTRGRPAGGHNTGHGIHTGEEQVLRSQRVDMLIAKSSRNDIGEYLKLCSEGKVYEFMLDEVRSRSWKPREIRWIRECRYHMQEVRFEIDPAKWTRSHVKKALLIAIFDRVEGTESSPIFQILNDTFPTVGKYILAAKRNRHQELAGQMQRLESHLMIDTVCQRLMLRNFGRPVLSVHDALYVPRSAAEEAKAEVEHAFAEMGVSVAVHVRGV